jgi:DNA-binding response OmpR family regulator
MEKHRILIIDDEHNIVEAIKFSLSRENYAILEARNGAEGLVLYKKHSPVLIILDLKMPEMGGLEFLDKLDLNVSGPAVIVITGHGSDQDIELCFQKGINAFIRKPFNIYEIRGLIRNSIKLKEAHKELEEKFNELQITQEKIIQQERILTVGKVVLRCK